MSIFDIIRMLLLLLLQVFALLHAGTAQRHVARTNYNDVSR